MLWDDYVKNGGNKAATPAFLPHSGNACGFVCCMEVSRVNERLANNTKHPRHLGPHLTVGLCPTISS